MDQLNSFTDIALFCIILSSVACGWLFGFFKGVSGGYNHAKNELILNYPISNVYFSESEEDRYSFIDMATNKFIMSGTFDECINFIHEHQGPHKKVVFSKLPEEEK